MQTRSVETTEGCTEDALSQGYAINLILSHVACPARALSLSSLAHFPLRWLLSQKESMWLRIRPSKETHLGKSHFPQSSWCAQYPSHVALPLSSVPQPPGQDQQPYEHTHPWI